jgi:hypothetical protein
MAGWPVQLRLAWPAGYEGRVVGDELTYFIEQQTDTSYTGTDSYEAWVTDVDVNGAIRIGVRVPRVDTSCCGERWAVGPDGVAYGVVHRSSDASIGPTSELLAVSVAGVPAGFPVSIDGIASEPAFDVAGRIHVTVATVTAASPYHGPARTLVFDTGGRAVDSGSGDLGLVATDDCVAIEGSCEGPAAPLVGADGTTFVIGAYFNSTIVSAVSPSGQVMAGWPYRSAAGHQGIGFYPAPDVDQGYNVAAPAIGPDNTLYLVHAAASAAVGGSIVAVGLDGRVRPGWPVELRRPGAEFWSVVVGSDGTAYALAIEPETGDGSSASILAIASDSTVLYTTTIIDR